MSGIHDQNVTGRMAGKQRVSRQLQRKAAQVVTPGDVGNIHGGKVGFHGLPPMVITFIIPA